MTTRDYQLYDLGTVSLQSGERLPNAQLAYKTYGELNSAGDNVVVLPTFYTGNHYRNEGFFGPGRGIDPSRHFIVSINLFGNGLSTSPSNAITSHRGGHFPYVSFFDNVQCQYRLLTEHLGVKRIALVAGWSMAGCQALHWASQYPDFVDAILPFCASAKTSIHNWVFLEGVKAALQADSKFQNGHYTTPPIDGLKAFGRGYAGWAFSQAFYRQQLFKQLGFASAEELLVDWENDHLNWDANDLLAKLATWQGGDISDQPRYHGNFVAALQAIRAKAIVIACSDDLYFPPEDNANEVEYLSDGELRIYASPWGHCVASPGNDPQFMAFFDQAVSELLT